MPTLGGIDIFGVAVQVRHVPNPTDEQTNKFFGVSGIQTLFGGGRGRTFEVRGLLVGSTQAAVVAAEQQIYSYADGLARTFVDNDGLVWTNVVFRGEFTPDANGIRPCSPYGYARPYSMVLRGLR